MTATTTLILPGLYDSGPEHWQSHWERRDAGCRRVVQDDWATPRIEDWGARLGEAVDALDPAAAPVVLAAHSSSCALVSWWASRAAPAQLARVAGALLVAPSDSERESYPAGPVGFAPMPLHPIPFHTIVAGSETDEYVTPERARAFARAWGSRYVSLGDAGHVNAASGYGPWDDGYAMLQRLRDAASGG